MKTLHGWHSVGITGVVSSCTLCIPDGDRNLFSYYLYVATLDMLWLWLQCNGALLNIKVETKVVMYA